jgi:hypothetical protein
MNFLIIIINVSHVCFHKLREDLLGQTKKAADDISKVTGLDNQGIVGLQRQIIKGTFL